MTTFAGLDHVLLTMPEGGEPEARAFWGDALGLTEVPKPTEMARRGGCWFQCGGQQIHCGVEAGFVPAKKAHPALRVADEQGYEALVARLQARGIAVEHDAEMEPGVRRFFTRDPWGSKVEVLVATGR